MSATAASTETSAVRRWGLIVDEFFTVAGNHRAHPDLQGAAWGVSWAPQGQRLAFGTFSLTEGLYVYDVYAGSPTKIAEGVDPTWSPDGRLIAFSSLRNPGVYLVAPDGSSPRRIADEGAPLAWAGDSKRLLFRRGSSIYVREVDGAVEHRVGEGEDASWSPDGSIAIVRRGNTYLVGADGSGERLLTAGRVVQWLPSGEDVLVQDPSGAVRLVSLGTGRSRRIAEDAQAASLRPQLDRLATVLVVGRRSEVYLSDPQGAGPTRITPSQCDQYTSRCVNGTDAADRIQGTPERDVIFPGAGDDRVWGRGGDDRIDTAYGRDFVDAGADNDIVVTHGNDDRLYGGPGIDLLRPSDGEDSVDGGPGRDTVFSDGDGRVDRVRCGPGNDVVFADPIDKIARDCERVRRPPD